MLPLPPCPVALSHLLGRWLDVALAPPPSPLRFALPLPALNWLSLVAMCVRASLSFTKRCHHTGPLRLQKSDEEVALKNHSFSWARPFPTTPGQTSGDVGGSASRTCSRSTLWQKARR